MYMTVKRSYKDDPPRQPPVGEGGEGDGEGEAGQNDAAEQNSTGGTTVREVGRGTHWSLFDVLVGH